MLGVPTIRIGEAINPNAMLAHSPIAWDLPLWEAVGEEAGSTPRRGIARRESPAFGPPGVDGT
jgi:hypothetical protein